MRHILITLLLVLTLLSQWSWVEHGYHEHEEGEICELCINASGNAALTSTKIELSNNPNIHVRFVGELDISVLNHPRFYASRAPPLFL